MNEQRTSAIADLPRGPMPRSVDLRRPPVRVMGRPGLGDRPALAAGHPVSWRLLTAGTVLDGADYPFPVFDI